MSGAPAVARHGRGRGGDVRAVGRVKYRGQVSGLRLIILMGTDHYTTVDVLLQLDGPVEGC